MSIEIRPCGTVEELRDALNGIGHYFGHDNTVEDAERLIDRLGILNHGGAAKAAPLLFLFATTLATACSRRARPSGARNTQPRDCDR